MKKIRKWIEILILKMSYSRCYDAHEGREAVFGMCECEDKSCPYNVSSVLITEGGTQHDRAK